MIDAAGPSMPVEVLGFYGTPDAGDRLAVVENEARAREVAITARARSARRWPRAPPACAARSSR